MNRKPVIKVFFNSACPVCNAGISFQQKKMQSCAVEWRDVHLDNKQVEEIGAGLEFVRERLHVIDEQGRLQIGFDAFIALWRNSPAEHWKAAVFSLPVIRQLSNLAYNGFARCLYRWNRRKQHW